MNKAEERHLYNEPAHTTSTFLTDSTCCDSAHIFPQTLRVILRPMSAPLNRTLAATLIATVAGTGSWLSGLARATWPAHPMVAVFLITILVTIAVMQAWPRAPKRPH